MATPPTVVLAATLPYIASSASRAFGSVTVATGDVCTISSRFADFQSIPNASKTAGTSTISAITVLQNNNISNTCRGWLASFTVTAGGTLTITHTDGTGTVPWGSLLFVATGCAGITSAAHTGSSVRTQSLTASANSQVYVSLGDWTALGSSTVAWTPASSVEDLAQTDGVTHQVAAGAQYGAYVAHWTNVAGGAVSYGITAPTPTNIDAIAWEFQGTASVAPPQPPEVRVVSQAVIRASYI
jgi:hypothetical protein